MLKIKNNFRFLHCILAYLVSFYSASRGGSFGVYPIRIRPLTCVLRTLCIILYKVWHTLDHIEASFKYFQLHSQHERTLVSGLHTCMCIHVCICTAYITYIIYVCMYKSRIVFLQNTCQTYLVYATKYNKLDPLIRNTLCKRSLD